MTKDEELIARERLSRLRDLPTNEITDADLAWWLRQAGSVIPTRVRTFAADRLEALAQPVVGVGQDLNGSDLYELANQLGGYVDTGTPPELAAFLFREAKVAAAMADEIVRLRAALAASPSPVVGDEGRMLLDLLATIHRDGGHHVHSVGLEQAWKEAITLSADRIVQRVTEREAIADTLHEILNRSDMPETGWRGLMLECADAILSLSTPVVGGRADSLVDAATGGRFSNLTAFTEAMLSADDDVSLDEMVGEAATLLHALAGSRPDPRTMDRAGMAQEVE